MLGILSELSEATDCGINYLKTYITYIHKTLTDIRILTVAMYRKSIF
jgi:hypothetical protein